MPDSQHQQDRVDLERPDGVVTPCAGEGAHLGVAERNPAEERYPRAAWARVRDAVRVMLTERSKLFHPARIDLDETDHVRPHRLDEGEHLGVVSAVERHVQTQRTQGGAWLFGWTRRHPEGHDRRRDQSGGHRAEQHVSPGPERREHENDRGDDHREVRAEVTRKLQEPVGIGEPGSDRR